MRPSLSRSTLTEREVHGDSALHAREDPGVRRCQRWQGDRIRSCDLAFLVWHVAEGMDGRVGLIPEATLALIVHVPGR